MIYRVKYLAMDVNGDGKSDLVRLVATDNGNQTYAGVFLSTSSGFTGDGVTTHWWVPGSAMATM
jgi:hypothetical protein